VKIALAQFDVAQSKPADNLDRLAHYAREAAAARAQLLCLPEMWLTGFNWAWNRKHAAEHNRWHDSIEKLAADHNLWLCGSTLSTGTDGHLHNTFTLIDPTGTEVARYDKTHLFSFINEHRYLTPGDRPVAAQTPWAHIACSICYDLRFPELFRTYALQNAELVFCPAAFPHPRLDHWRTLLRARAIENQLFIVATNQVGHESFGPANHLDYFGHSLVIDPWGQILLEGPETEAFLTVEIDIGKVAQTRRTMSVLDDRRPDIYPL